MEERYRREIHANKKRQSNVALMWRSADTRASFVTRLRETVNWMNDNLTDEGKNMRTNKKERAKDISSLEGAKSKW